jgi:predicted site-specific integrase-resolvase
MLPAEVCAYLRVSPHTLKSWRRKRVGPEYAKLGDTQNARIRYPRSAVEEFARTYLQTAGVR